MVLFGQMVIGPPGAGKTTYCLGMKTFMEKLGRECAIINLDFANDSLPYIPSIDIRELSPLENTMEKYELGPNGSIVFCMEALLEDSSWLLEKISSLDSNYILFDCPGQVELHTHYKCMPTLLEKLKELEFRLCSVHLVDSFYCSQPNIFISAVLLATTTMLRLGLPNVNVLSKVDLLSVYGRLPFNLDFYTEMLDLTPILRYLEAPAPREVQATTAGSVDAGEGGDGDESEPVSAHAKQRLSGSSSLREKHLKLTRLLCEVVNDYGMVSFLPLCIDDGETIGRVLAAIDVANGYRYAQGALLSVMHVWHSMAAEEARNVLRSKQSEDNHLNTAFKLASRNLESVFDYSLSIQEKYCRPSTK